MRPPDPDPILTFTHRGDGRWTLEPPAPPAPPAFVSTELLALEDVLRPQPCPLCDRDRLGFPRRLSNGTWSADHWAPALRWVKRRDLHSTYDPVYVCPICDADLGTDYIGQHHDLAAAARAREAAQAALSVIFRWLHP